MLPFPLSQIIQRAMKIFTIHLAPREDHVIDDLEAFDLWKLCIQLLLHHGDHHKSSNQTRCDSTSSSLAQGHTAFRLLFRNMAPSFSPP